MWRDDPVRMALTLDPRPFEEREDSTPENARGNVTLNLTSGAFRGREAWVTADPAFGEQHVVL